MTCNATIKCVEYLWRQGVQLSDIRISTPILSLRKIRSSRFIIGTEAACQTPIPYPTPEDPIEELYSDLNMSAVDLDNLLSKLIQDLTE